MIPDNDSLKWFKWFFESHTNSMNENDVVPKFFLVFDIGLNIQNLADEMSPQLHEPEPRDSSWF